MNIQWKILDGIKFAPKKGSEEAAGIDLFAPEDGIVEPLQRKVIKLGIKGEFPKGFTAILWDRSGLAAKQGITVLGGLVDSDYRGEWMVTLFNTTGESFRFKAGERICQVVFLPIPSVEVVISKDLSESKRGEGGLGSTGK